MSPFVRTVKTASGATAVQIVYSHRRGSRDIEHIGSAHDEARLELLKAAARQRLAAGEGELDLDVGGVVASTGGVVAGSMVGRCRLRPRGWRPVGCARSGLRPARVRCRQ